MSQTNISPEVQNAVKHMLYHPEVQKLAEQLAKYGLGVSVPHMHEGDNVLPLSPGKVQLEQSLQVSFVPQSEAEAVGAFPVMIMFDRDSGTIKKAAWCCD